MANCECHKQMACLVGLRGIFSRLGAISILLPLLVVPSLGWNWHQTAFHRCGCDLKNSPTIWNVDLMENQREREREERGRVCKTKLTDKTGAQLLAGGLIYIYIYIIIIIYIYIYIYVWYLGLAPEKIRETVWNRMVSLIVFHMFNRSSIEPWFL